MTRAISAALLTIVTQMLLTLALARYDWLSPFIGLWVLGVPVAVGFLVFRTWGARLWSLPALVVVGVLAIMVVGLLR